MSVPDDERTYGRMDTAEKVKMDEEMHPLMAHDW